VTDPKDDGALGSPVGHDQLGDIDADPATPAGAARGPVSDADCVRFLQWALPRLGMRWRGFRRVRRQVCKRIARRIKALGLSDLSAYRALLETHPEEWAELDALCRITVSRFFRDRGVFEAVRDMVLPELARRARGRGDTELRCWSAGCASGEEAFTLAILWERGLRRHFPDLGLRVLGTDADPEMIRRARGGRYAGSSLKELPETWREAAFERTDGSHQIRASLGESVEFRREDIRTSLPAERFHLILCRNLVFTYFEERVQRECLARIASRLLPGGALVVGIHESLPADGPGLVPWRPDLGIFRHGP
jgi:chemotaxis protein methyltransferase CheR